MAYQVSMDRKYWMMGPTVYSNSPQSIHKWESLEII
jgi:hypothetical protein